MKLAIEESVLRRWTELCEKGHGQTVSEELRTALDAAEKVEDQLAAVTAERDELKATIGYETQYKKAYIELSGKTGELETKINELRNKVQKTEAERDHYHRERDIWVRSNKQLQEQLASVKKELDELVADAKRYRWLRDTQGGKTVRIMFRQEWDEVIDVALAKLGADKGE